MNQSILLNFIFKIPFHRFIYLLLDFPGPNYIAHTPTPSALFYHPQAKGCWVTQPAPVVQWLHFKAPHDHSHARRKLLRSSPFYLQSLTISALSWTLNACKGKVKSQKKSGRWNFSLSKVSRSFKSILDHLQHAVQLIWKPTNWPNWRCPR